MDEFRNKCLGFNSLLETSGARLDGSSKEKISMD